MPKWKGWGSKVQPSMNEIIPEIRYKLGNQKEKLEDVAERLYQRDKEILHRCVGAQMCGDNDRSKIFANECAEIRKMYTTVKAAQISLEKVIIRFDSISIFEKNQSLMGSEVENSFEESSRSAYSNMC